MPRKQKKFHYIYKTTCNVTKRFYYGMHSTDNLEDGYLGSGQRLWYSINKYGRENHSIEILEHYTDRESLKAREKELVNEDMLKDPMCMNIKIGGEGGCTKECQIKRSIAGRISLTNKLKNNPEFKSKYSKAISESLKGNTNTLGLKHSDITKKKMSMAQSGCNNSQYGTCWIHNKKLKQNKKIYRGDLIPNGWELGRKINF